MMKENASFFAWSGFRWIAISILLVAYFLVSQQYVSGNSFAFNAINGFGSILLIVNSLSLKPKDWPVAVFNLIWTAISLAAIAKLLLV